MIKKKAYIIMLPNIHGSYNSGLYLDSNNKLHPHNVTNGGRQQHLYVLSDEAVKDGEWCFEMHNGDSQAINPIIWIDEMGNKWYLRKMNMNCSANDPECKKLIATTDTSLRIPIDAIMTKALPSLTKIFINKFIAEYNQYNLIFDVMIEYEQLVANEIDGLLFMAYELTPKVDEDNSINIISFNHHPWDRETVERYCRTAFFAGFANGSLPLEKAQAVLDEWVSENFK